MTQLIFEIDNQSDFEVLVSIAHERRIKYRTKTADNSAKKEREAKRAIVLEKIKTGKFNTPNIQKMILGFDEYRKDKPLFGRE